MYKTGIRTHSIPSPRRTLVWGFGSFLSVFQKTPWPSPRFRIVTLYFLFSSSDMMLSLLTKIMRVWGNAKSASEWAAALTVCCWSCNSLFAAASHPAKITARATFFSFVASLRASHHSLLLSDEWTPGTRAPLANKSFGRM